MIGDDTKIDNLVQVRLRLFLVTRTIDHSVSLVSNGNQGALFFFSCFVDWS